MKSRIVLVVILLCTQLAYSQTTRYWVGGATAAFNAVASWSTAGVGGTGNGFPAAGDILIVDGADISSAVGLQTGAVIITAVATIALNNFTLQNNADITLQSTNPAKTLTLGGGAGADLVINLSSTLTISTNVNLTMAAAATATVDGILAIETGRTFTSNGTAVTTVNGTVNNTGTITSTAAGLVFSATGIYNHTQNAGTIPTATWNATSICNVIGSTAAAPTGLNQTFGDFNFNCGVLTGARTATLTGAMVVQGDFTIIGTSGANTMTLQVAGNNFTVNGTTTINSYGIISDNNGGGTNLFVGLVTVNLNGQWNVPQNCTFRGGLTVNSSTFIGTAIYTFNTNDQTLSGTQSFSITNVVCGTAGRTLTNANINGFTIAGTLSGAGNFTNGTPVFQAVLYLSANADPMSTFTGTKDFTSNINTVNYSGAGAQTIGAYNFYNLTASGGGTRTLVNGGTIGISGLFTPSGTYVTTNNTINFNGTGTQNIPTLTAPYYNNIIISGNSTKTLIGNVIIGAAGIVNLSAGVLDLANFNLTINNNAVNAIQGAFSSTNMIATSGTGYLERNAGATFPQSYPIGAGGYYSPATIIALTTGSPTIRVRAIPTALNPSYINKYWDVTIPHGRLSAR